jgi:hypothetical protein
MKDSKSPDIPAEEESQPEAVCKSSLDPLQAGETTS